MLSGKVKRAHSVRCVVAGARHLARREEALALRSGVTRNVLIDVEQERRGLLYERLFDLAEALQVPAAQLLGGNAYRQSGSAAVSCDHRQGVT
jgi:transcriptional regulator with XRE-family HTH domain